MDKEEKFFEKNDRLKGLQGSASRQARYRAFRDELQREIFDNKNYDVSIVELSKKYRLTGGSSNGRT